MAVAQGYGKIVTSGSVFAYDTGDTRNSYKGRPTTNSIAGTAIYNYNNVPGNVTTAITTTGETYKGATVYKQTITPLDSTGVSYLTNANNPGIGVYTGGGGGTGGVYTGHSIFFKPTGPMYTTPIYTHYANIGGYQSTGDYEDMGDGWFKAKVIWYNGSTLYDQKYWAINPSGATTNVPITVYWAGPFKESLNSTVVSQFVEGTRSATQGLIPLVGNSTIDLTNLSFDSNVKLYFDGTNDYFIIPYSSNLDTPNGCTYELMIYPTGAGEVINRGTNDGVDNPRIYIYANGAVYFDWSSGGTDRNVTSSTNLTMNTWNHLVCTATPGSALKIYINSLQVASGTTQPTPLPNTSNDIEVGRASWLPRYGSAKIDVLKIYNRALSAAEVRQNYLHYKTRFNLS